MEPKQRVILDLCGGTGAWSKPYKDAGYDVRVITLPDFDVRTFIPPPQVYGILAAPPCTMFSFARTKARKPRNLKEGMECVRACLHIIWCCMEVEQSTALKTLPLKFWALENPYHGFLRKFLGKPSLIFDPWEFGDGYQKKTALWGHFNEPKRIKNRQIVGHPDHNHEKMVKFDYLKSKNIHPDKFGILDRQTRRSITPEGFARAFFKANQ